MQQPGGWHAGKPGPGESRLEIGAAELMRARTIYRGALESARAWRGFSPSARHHDLTYWSLLCALFVAPGSNRTALIEQIIDHAGVSRSTAERAIRAARASGYIVDRPFGKEVRYYLSDHIFNHCIKFFREKMNLHEDVGNRGFGEA